MYPPLFSIHPCHLLDAEEAGLLEEEEMVDAPMGLGHLISPTRSKALRASKELRQTGAGANKMPHALILSLLNQDARIVPMLPNLVTSARILNLQIGAAVPRVPKTQLADKPMEAKHSRDNPVMPNLSQETTNLEPTRVGIPVSLLIHSLVPGRVRPTTVALRMARGRQTSLVSRVIGITRIGIIIVSRVLTEAVALIVVGGAMLATAARKTLNLLMLTCPMDHSFTPSLLASMIGRDLKVLRTGRSRVIECL